MRENDEYRRLVGADSRIEASVQSEKALEGKSRRRNQISAAIRTPSGNLVKAFDVRISGHDVYVIYSDCSVRAAHSSYHASGQYHIKIGKRYVQPDGGPTATMEPMKLFRTPPG